MRGVRTLRARAELRECSSQESVFRSEGGRTRGPLHSIQALGLPVVFVVLGGDDDDDGEDGAEDD